MSHPDLTNRGREMLALMREYENSGGDVSEFARRAGVKPQTFTWWRRRLRRHLAQETPDFLELVVKNDSRSCADPMRVIVGSDVVVEVPLRFNGDELRRLVEVLRGC